VAIDVRPWIEAVVLRCVVGVVDRAEDDLDVSLLTERVRPLDAEIASDRIVDAEQQAERAFAARELQARRSRARACAR
jgi:hypothetical protein